MSLMNAIDSKCKSCSYVEGDQGTWRKQIEMCGGVSCELYGVRPLTSDAKHPVRGSRRDAIDKHCKSCIYDQQDSTAKGTWRQQVRACTSTDCELWEHRPMPDPGSGKIEVVNV